MFKEKLDNEKLDTMAKNYLSIVAGEKRAETLLEDGKKVVTPKITRYDFTDENQRGQFVAISDYDAFVSCAIEPVQEIITMMHRKEMYKTFGKEYLSNLNHFYKDSIRTQYEQRLSEVDDMIEEIQK